MAKGNYFPKVREAREALREKALELYELQVQLILQAAAAQKFEEALKANQWLLEHMPAGEDGERLIDPSAAKPKEISSGPSGPQIQIGIKFGGIDKPKELETKPIVEVIDVTPTLSETNDRTDTGTDPPTS